MSQLRAAQFYVADSLTAQIARVSGRLPVSPNILLMGADRWWCSAVIGRWRRSCLRREHGRRRRRLWLSGGACVITKMFSLRPGCMSAMS